MYSKGVQKEGQRICKGHLWWVGIWSQEKEEGEIIWRKPIKASQLVPEVVVVFRNELTTKRRLVSLTKRHEVYVHL